LFYKRYYGNLEFDIHTICSFQSFQVRRKEDRDCIYEISRERLQDEEIKADYEQHHETKTISYIYDLSEKKRGIDMRKWKDKLNFRVSQWVQSTRFLWGGGHILNYFYDFTSLIIL
jgi:hypothetical protein